MLLERPSPIIRPPKGHALAEVLLTKPSKANGKGGQKGMEIKVQITVKSEVGEPEVVREVARLERGSLRSETLGLSLAEGKCCNFSILPKNPSLSRFCRKASR